MKLNQRKIGSILSYIQMAVSIVLSIVYTPVMLRLLGESEYGLYNIASSTISMMSILNLGFNSGYIRYYSKYKRSNDTESLKKLNGLFLLLFTIIGTIVLVCGLILTSNLRAIFDSGLTEGEYAIAKVLMLILTVTLAISFPMGVFSNIISAHEKFVFLKLLGIARTVISPMLTIILLLKGYKSIAMVSVSLALSIIVDAIYLFYVLVILKQRFSIGLPEKGIFGGLFTYSIFIAINMIVDQINLNIDKVLLGRFKGTTAVSIYTIGYCLHHYYQTFSTSISSVFTPMIHGIIAELREDTKKMTDTLTALFIKVGRIQYLILMLLCTGVIFFGREFIYFWTGSESYGDSYYVAILLIIPSTVPLIQNIGIETQRALNRHQFRSIAYIIMASINLGLSIYLCQLYGAVGSAIGTAISVVLANGIVMNVFYHKRCFVNMIAFWKSILRLSVGLIIPVAVGVFIMVFINIENVFALLGSIILYTVVYCASMWLFGMNTYEKELVLGPVKKIFKKS